jgi:hypothetical protein
MSVCREIPRAGALLAVGLVALGCDPNIKRRHIASEDDPVVTPSVEQPLGPFTRFAEIESLAQVSKLRSGHPVGNLAGVVKVDAKASGYGQRGRGAFPPGALVVEALGPDPDGPPTLFYVMEKRETGFFPLGGDWQYSVVTAAGKLEADGKLELCARCHAEAPRDYLFEYGAARPTPATQ